MANWISSKLKVAETLLQHIDQQAAESLGKNEKEQSPSAYENDRKENLKKIDSASTTPLKYQLPKKSPQPTRSPSPHPIHSLPPSDISTTQQSQTNLVAIDWTELLSSPSQPIPVASPSEKKIKRNTNKKKPLISSSLILERKKRILSTSLGDDDSDVKENDAKKDFDEKGVDTVADVAESFNVVQDDESSGSLSGSADSSGTDSEDERLRREERKKRREQMIAERAAAAAAKAIKDREDVVAKLEGEKQSLEKILKEREKQQAKEALELQTSMIETMEAAEIEKEKHNSTRMEAFTRLAKLETTNAELARSLATSQWNLEVQVNRISELLQEIELREMAQQEHKRRMLKLQQKSSSLSKEEPVKKDELQHEILEAEYSVICNKTAQLKDKAKMLEEKIESTKQGRLYPSEVETELKRRLSQLTDHLIQKQTQVEALSSEKATLSLRIEMVSRMLDENGSPLQDIYVSNDITQQRFDIEAQSCRRPNKSEALHERIRAGQRQLGSLVQQLDSVFSTGVTFIRRNPMALLWSCIYLFFFHIWVLYILFASHSHVSEGDTGHGAVVSLESISKTSSS